MLGDLLPRAGHVRNHRPYPKWYDHNHSSTVTPNRIPGMVSAAGSIAAPMLVLLGGRDPVVAKRVTDAVNDLP